MKSDIETLKAWCHWKRKETGVSQDDLDFVKAIEDTISQVGNWKAKHDRLLSEVTREAALGPEDPGPERDAEWLAEEFRLVMKGFDVYLEQSPNPGALKNHIAAALKLNAEIHRLAAIEEVALAVAGPNEGYLHGCDCRLRVRALKGKP